jgi:hypothetical protein
MMILCEEFSEEPTAPFENVFLSIGKSPAAEQLNLIFSTVAEGNTRFSKDGTKIIAQII